MCFPAKGPGFWKNVGEFRQFLSLPLLKFLFSLDQKFQVSVTVFKASFLVRQASGQEAGWYPHGAATLMARGEKDRTSCCSGVCRVPSGAGRGWPAPCCAQEDKLSGPGSLQMVTDCEKLCHRRVLSLEGSAPHSEGMGKWARGNLSTALFAGRPPTEPQSLWLEPSKSQVGASCFRDAGPALSLPPVSWPCSSFLPCRTHASSVVLGGSCMWSGVLHTAGSTLLGGCFVLPWVPQESNVDCLPVVCPVLPRAECLACRVCVGVCLAKYGSFGATHDLPLGSPLPSFEGFVGIRVAVSLALGLIAPTQGCPLCWCSLGALH